MGNARAALGIAFDDTENYEVIEAFAETNNARMFAKSIDGNLKGTLFNNENVIINADQTPIINIFTYELPNNKLIIDNGTIEFPFTCNQQEELTVGDNIVTGPINITTGLYEGLFVQTNGAVNVNTSTTSSSFPTFIGVNKVQLNPGFKATPNNSGIFNAHIGANSNFCTNGTDALQVGHYFGNCTPSPFFRLANGRMKNNLSSQEIVELNTGLKMYVAPNPNNGNFKLLFNQNISGGKIKIVSILGDVVYELDTNSEMLSEITLNSTLLPGTYMLTVYNNTITLNQKFIVE